MGLARFRERVPWWFLEAPGWWFRRDSDLLAMVSACALWDRMVLEILVQLRTGSWLRFSRFQDGFAVEDTT